MPAEQPGVTMHFYLEPFSDSTQNFCNQCFMQREGEFPPGVPHVLAGALAGREAEWEAQVRGPLAALCRELVDFGKFQEMFFVPVFFVLLVLQQLLPAAGADEIRIVGTVAMVVIVFVGVALLLVRRMQRLAANEEVDRKIQSFLLRENEAGLLGRIGAQMLFQYEQLGCGRDAKHIRYFSIRPKGGHATLNP